MDRLVLDDTQWAQMSESIIGRPDQSGSTGRNNQMFVERVLWTLPPVQPLE